MQHTGTRLPTRSETERSDLSRRTVLVAAALFLTTASFTLARTARDAIYFQGGGIFDLPYENGGCRLPAPDGR